MEHAALLVTNIETRDAARSACACPRCDYDLMGEVESWKEKCPLEGRCPECGLELAWHELLSATHTTPHWSFEHARTRRGRAFVGTVWRAVLPWRMARSLRLHHPFRARRLALLIVMSALTLYGAVVFHALPTAANRVIETFQYRGAAPFPLVDALRFIAWPFGFDPYARQRMSAAVMFAPLLVIWACVVSVLFSLVPVTIRRHRVSPRHFVRMGAYCCAAVLAFAAVEQALFAAPGINYLQSWVTGAYASWPDRWPHRVVEWMQNASLLWMGVYWWCAFRFYMRLPHAAAMALLLNVIGAMIALLLVLLFTGMLR